MIQPVLLQVKVIEDPDKYGFTLMDIRRDFASILRLSNIKIEGLMTICPLSEDSTIWKQCFNGLRILRDELEITHGIKLKELSMGMTQDWVEAVACGSTMVRLGRAIFSS